MQLKVCENCIYLLGATSISGEHLTGCGSPLYEPSNTKRQPDAPCNQWEFYDWALRAEWAASEEEEDIKALEACQTEGGELIPWEDVKKRLGLD